MGDIVTEHVQCSACWNERDVRHVFGVRFDGVAPPHPAHLCFACYSYYKYECDQRERQEQMNARVRHMCAGAPIRITVCPSCGHGVEKTSGCNIVRCRCRAIFDYRTGERLGESEFAHYADTPADFDFGYDLEIALQNMTLSDVIDVVFSPFVIALVVAIMICCTTDIWT